MKKSILLLIMVLGASAAFCACGTVSAQTDDKIAQIKEEYPAVFGLDTSKGLDIIVWQLAEHDYQFALRPHSDKELSVTDEYLMSYGAYGLSAEQLKSVLSTYAVSKDDLHVVYWQSAVSSYIPPEAVRDEDGYIKSVRDMLNI